jgi:hypothetical protein
VRMRAPIQKYWASHTIREYVAGNYKCQFPSCNAFLFLYLFNMFLLKTSFETSGSA